MTKKKPSLNFGTIMKQCDFCNNLWLINSSETFPIIINICVLCRSDKGYLFVGEKKKMNNGLAI